MTDPKNSEEALYRAAEIKTQVKLLMEEYSMLEVQVLERVKILSAGTDKYAVKVGEYGTFSVVPFRTWTYTPKTTELEAEVKQLKKTEEADGSAKAEIKDTLRFTGAKAE